MQLSNLSNAHVTSVHHRCCHLGNPCTTCTEI